MKFIRKVGTLKAKNVPFVAWLLFVMDENPYLSPLNLINRPFMKCKVTGYIACFLFLLLCAPVQGQLNFKKIYTPDSLTLTDIGLFSAEEVIYTGIPGRELAVTGYITGSDTTGYSLQSAYLLQLSEDGDPQRFSHYHDTSFLFYPGARGYGACYDNNGHFYLAIGTNDNCVLVKTDTMGNILWTTDGGHHDYYGVTYRNGTLAILGQNESFTGAQDYSITQVDETGASSTPDMMFGTIGFDVPTAMANTPDGYMMVGFAANGPDRGNMMVQTDMDLNVVWSRVWQVPNKRVTGVDVKVLPNHHGYITTGQIDSQIGGMDSIYVMKVDTGGNAVWMRQFGLRNHQSLIASSIDYVPVTEDILVGGYYRVGSFGKGFVMSLDSAGNFLWARDYANADTTIEESITDITVGPSGQTFYATGKYVEFDGVNLTNKVLVWKAPIHDGDIPCDTTLLFGARLQFPFDGQVVFTEPFSDNDPYPLVAVTNGVVNQQIECTTLVNLVDDLEEKEYLQVVNPVEENMIVTYDIPLEAGILELHDLQGKVLMRKYLEPGSDRLEIPANEVPAGLYVILLRTEEQILSHKKLLFR